MDGVHMWLWAKDQRAAKITAVPAFLETYIRVTISVIRSEKSQVSCVSQAQNTLGCKNQQWKLKKLHKCHSCWYAHISKWGHNFISVNLPSPFPVEGCQGTEMGNQWAQSKLQDLNKGSLAVRTTQPLPVLCCPLRSETLCPVSITI